MSHNNYNPLAQQDEEQPSGDLPSYAETTGFSDITSNNEATTEELLSVTSNDVDHEQDLTQSVSTSELNPEARKKLNEEMRRNGLSKVDYGFFDGQHEPNDNLPSFGETELNERPHYSINGNGDVVSHDARLNSSPDFLLRFLKQHASSPPTFTVSMRGSHIEWKDKSKWHKRPDGSTYETRHPEREEVEDFSFSIDCTNQIEQGLGSAKGIGGGGMRGYLYAVGDWEPVQRGGAFMTQPFESKDREGSIRLNDDEEQALSSDDRQNMKRRQESGYHEVHSIDRDTRQRRKTGMPSFVHPQSLIESETDFSRPPHTLMEHPARLFRSHFVDLTEVHASNPTKPIDSTSWPQSWQTLLDERNENDMDVRRIVNEYCHSTAFVKELVIARSEIYGWNIQQLEQGLRSVIERSYGGTIDIKFNITPTTITVRPDNWVSRLFNSSLFVKVLLWIVLIYPCLLMYYAGFGKKWHNVRCAFPLTRWRRVPIPTKLHEEWQRTRNTTASSSREDTSLAMQLTHDQALSIVTELHSSSSQNLSFPSNRVAQLPLPSNRSLQTPGPWIYLCGTLEGEWLKNWEMAITNSVRTRVRQRTLTNEDRDEVTTRIQTELTMLRGYEA
ncbi:hypothetical protein OIO90_002959 [Microbotryomycetes sp. JL221]|nr:hypothetical protein OIO90_002959 [Microbotryomycetes sp. JL221]